MRKSLIAGAVVVGILLFAVVDYVAVSNWSFGGYHDTEAWRGFSAIPLYGSGRWFGPIQRILVQPLSGMLTLPGGTKLTRLFLFSGKEPSIARFHVLFSLVNSVLWSLCLVLLMRLF